MSDGVAKLYYSSDGQAGLPIHYYQSAWMSHWAGTGYDTSTPKHNYSLSPRGGNKEDHNLNTHQFLSGAEIARSARRLCGSAQNIIGMQASRPDASGGKLPAVLNILPVSVPAAETSTRECQFQPEGLLQLPVNQVKYHMFFGENNFSLSRQRSTMSESHTVPNRLDIEQFKFDNGRTVVPSFIHRREETKQVTSILSSKHVTKTNLMTMVQEHCNYQGHSAGLVCESKTCNLPECEKGATSYLRQNNTPALKIGPSASTYNSPADDNGQYHRMKNNFGGKFFPSSSHPSEMNKPGNLQYGQCTQENIPRVCDGLDSAVGLAGGQCRFSQTTRSLFITQRTDFNLCKDNQILEESKGTTQLDQNTFSEFGRNFPLFNYGKQGIKRKLLGSSTDSEEKKDAGAVKTPEMVQKNESSAETDIMDVESFREKDHLSGVSPPQSNKDMMMDPNLEPKIASTAASGSRERTINLPDINLELPAEPPSPDTIEKPEPSTSRTQSLDMELLLNNADKPGNSKSSDCQVVPHVSELSSRWVKRLKLTTPNSASLRINNSNHEEPLSHEDGNNPFSKTMKSPTSPSEPTTGHRPGKEPMEVDKSTKNLETGEPSSIVIGIKEQDITLSHSWIQRWRHNQDKKKPETLATCHPRRYRFGTEDLEKKRFPSVAAMALMGKVMNGLFQPCQFQKKKSFIVWNTKNL